MKIDKKQQDLIDHNYVAATGSLISNSIAGEFFNSFKLSMFNSGAPNNPFNSVFVKEGTTKPGKYIQNWEQFYVPRQISFHVSFKPGLESNFKAALLERGYTEERATPVMTLSRLPDKITPHKQLTIKQVSKLDELGHFQEIAEKSYSLPEGSGPYVITERIMNLPDIELYVGYADQQAACISVLVKTGPVAGIYWVGTKEEFRNHGFGKAITEYAIVAGKRKDCKFACLQASEMGKPVYENLGFDNPYNYRSYTSPAT